MCRRKGECRAIHSRTLLGGVLEIGLAESTTYAKDECPHLYIGYAEVRGMGYLVALVAMAAWSWTAPAAVHNLTIDKVAWLQGCWQLASPQRVVEEHWMAPRAKSMLGMGRTVRGETLVEHESVLIKEQGGQLAYEAHPPGSRPRSFLRARRPIRKWCSRIPRTTFLSASAIAGTDPKRSWAGLTE